MQGMTYICQFECNELSIRVIFSLTERRNAIYDNNAAITSQAAQSFRQFESGVIIILKTMSIGLGQMFQFIRKIDVSNAEKTK